MATTNLNITDLDFDNIKESIKGFLSTVTEFKDFDFTGSNLSNLIDILAYNTYYNGYYVNMVANEMFLDTALLRESVLSRAKELNYLPRSATAAKAVVKLSITSSSSPATINIPKGTTFSTTSDGQTFTFSTLDSYVAFPVGTSYEAENVELFEGELLSYTYAAFDSDAPEKFVIPNDNVDVNNLDVFVKNSATDNTLTRHNKATTLLNVKSTDPVYFLEGYTGNQYRLVFGDGAFGKPLKDGNIVSVHYCATNGTEPNGADDFSYETGITSSTAVTVTTLAPASGGTFEESLESIKFNAPRHYSTQDRVVTANDYRTVLQQAYPQFKSVRAYGGEDAIPPEYGKVFVTIRPTIGETLTSVEKADVIAFLKNKSVIGIKPEVIDPNYVYLQLNYTFNFDSDATPFTSENVTTKVKNKILDFGETELGRFNATLRASKLAAAIDGLDEGILGSGGTIAINKRLTPTIGSENSFNIDFNNAIRILDPVGGTSLSVVNSTVFTSGGRRVRIVDDGSGVLNIVATGSSGVEEIFKSNIGTVDYLTGKVSVNRVQIDDFDGSNLTISVTPQSFDIVPINNQILLIDSRDVNVIPIIERTSVNV